MMPLRDTQTKAGDGKAAKRVIWDETMSGIQYVTDEKGRKVAVQIWGRRCGP
jgi:hypothetical protein